MGGRCRSRIAVIRVFLASAVLLASARPATASRESAALRAKAFDAVYNLDYDEARALLERAIAADASDAAAHRGLATVTWLHLIFRRGGVTVDEYLGGVTRRDLQRTPPPAEAAARFREHATRSLALAEARLKANPRDAAAHFDVGAAVGVMVSYTATIEGSVLGAFRAARRAYDEHEKVLQLDPRRKDAGLIVGTYRYVVAALALPLRVMAYVAGFGGSKERGIQMIEDAARHPSESQPDALTALVLLYNRERRWDDALRALGELQRRYPRNRILWLESGATALRAGRVADAERFLDEGLARLAGDGRPRMFGEEALWLYKRGAARVALRRLEAGEADLRRALGVEARRWVHGRARTELARIALVRGDRARAGAELEAARRLLESDNDSIGLRELTLLRGRL